MGGSKKKAAKFTLLIFSFVILNSNLFSAPKKKAKNKREETEVVEVQEPVTTEDAIKLPSNTKPRTYFYKIDESILADVENGTPDSIRSAMSRIRKSESDYAENEKVLINVAHELMSFLWESEKITWDVFEVTEANSYLGAFNSARNGVFDTSTGDVDFLSTIIPVLVVFTENVNSDVYEQCRASVEKALEFNSESVLANYVAGVFYLKTKDYAQAENYLNKAYEKSVNTMEIVIQYTNVLVLNNKATVASQVLARLPVNGAENIKILKQRAYVSFANKEYSAAENYVAKVLQQTPNDLEFLLFRAKIYIEKNDYIHAASLLDMYARQNDTNIEYLILRARIQLEWSKQTVAATETIEKALRLYPDSEEALMLATRISSVTDAPVAGKYADELAAIMLQKNGQNDEALIYALEGLVQRENWQEAYEISSQLVKKSDADPEVILRHVTVCERLHKDSEALNVATKAYASNPNNEEIIQAYVLAYSLANSRDASLSLINSLLSASSSKMKSYLYYRRSFLQLTEDSSLADLRSSLMENPRNSDSLFRLYEVYYTKSDYRKAQYYLRQVVAINPNDSSIRQLNESLTQLIK